MTHITGTHFNYHQICHRKLWLFANGIQMEQTSDLVYEGKLIHETTYPQRNPKYEEIEIGGVKIDFYDAKNKVVHEIKKSSKKEKAHIWQLKYYLYVLQKHGIHNAVGVLEYPTERKTNPVELTTDDCALIEQHMLEIENIISSNTCPHKIQKSKCRNCSYLDFCYANEIIE